MTVLPVIMETVMMTGSSLRAIKVVQHVRGGIFQGPAGAHAFRRLLAHGVLARAVLEHHQEAGTFGSYCAGI